MANDRTEKPIKLSNRTAIGLKRSAMQVRRAWLVAMGVTTMIVVLLATYFGLMWLPAVLLTLLVGAAVLALMFLASRCQYLMLISQAICTESAYLSMKEKKDEKRRRRRAIEELAAMRADVRDAMKSGAPAPQGRGEESLLFDLLTGREPSEEELAQRRRSEEDEEMYAASYTGEEDAQADAEDDLYPPKKSKTPQAAASSFATGSTKPLERAVRTPQAVRSEAPADEEGTDGQDESAPRRRRRRSAPTAPLQLIRNEQAK